MNTYLNMTKNALEKEKIRYNEFDECTIGVAFTREDDSHINFSFRFDEETDNGKDKGNHIHLSTFVENANMKDMYSNALVLCNNLNKDYRWARFYIDNDYDIACDADAILSESNAGEECLELMFRLMRIIDEAAPRIKQLMEFAPSAAVPEKAATVLS